MDNLSVEARGGRRESWNEERRGGSLESWAVVAGHTISDICQNHRNVHYKEWVPLYVKSVSQKRAITHKNSQEIL